MNTLNVELLKKTKERFDSLREKDNDLRQFHIMCLDVLQSKRNENIFTEFEPIELLDFVYGGILELETEIKKHEEYKSLYCDSENDYFSSFLVESFLDIDLLTDGNPKAPSNEYFRLLKESTISGRCMYLENIYDTCFLAFDKLRNIVSDDTNSLRDSSYTEMLKETNDSL